MSTIEERVTKLVFDTSKFGPALQTVLGQLEKLESSLKFDGAQKGFENVSDAANKFSMAGMKDQISGVMAHFGALQVAAITALSNIVNRAVDAGLQIVKSLTIAPVMDGFHEYETNLNSIQTILANTGLKGAEGLAKVNAKLDELNTYSDQTIYNFSEMARNIGTFTAAGVNLDIATSAIKGIANLAAISGSNAEQASAAMYQLSQALAAGKVTLEDWNSVVNAGMGGKVFQDSLIETARLHGVKIDEMIKKQGSFRLSLEKGWLTTDILTETLKKFTGELSAEQLKSMGYTDKQAKDILELGKTAVEAATKVKTITQLLDTLREAAGSGWAKTWQIVFGDFNEARGMFTDASNVLGGAINQMSDARNHLLQGWKDLGGRDALIQGIANAFQALLSVLRPIGQAFREMFPAVTAKNLYDLSVSFRDFMERLKLGDETANNLRRTFAGFFAILGIGWDLIKAGLGFIAGLIEKFSGGSSSVLRFTGNIGDFLVSLRKFLQEGKVFEQFFIFLRAAIDAIVKVLETFGRALGKIFEKVDFGPAVDALHKFGDAAKPVADSGDRIKEAWNSVGEFFAGIVDVAYRAIVKLYGWILKVKDAIVEMFSSSNGGPSTGEGLFKAAGLTALIAFLNTLRNFFKTFKPGEFLNNITESFEALTGALKGMQHALNASALLAIAGAIFIMATAMEKLSKIDSDGLIRASSAIAVLMTEMAAAFILFDKVGGTFGAAKIIVVSTALIRIGAALLILVTAVEKLAKLDWEQLAKGLTGVMVLMAALVAAVRFLPTDTGGVVKTATSLLVLTVAIRNLANAVEDLGKLSWEELGKGLAGVAALLLALGLFTKIADLNKGGIAAGIGILLISTSLQILADAVGAFVKYNWEQLGRGMAGIAVGIGLIAGALYLLPPTSIFSATGVLIVATSLHLIGDAVGKMADLSWAEIGRGMTVMAGALLAIALAIGFLPPTSLLSAVGILIVAASLGMIQEALGKMSGMTWAEIGRGLIVLAGSLLIIAGAMFLMQNAVPGAFALLVISAALRVFTPVIQALGEMSWEAIAKGLAALAGVFLVLGVAAVLLGPFVGIITGLAGSIALLGVAVLAAGVGVLAFAVGLGLLAAVGAGATAALVGIVTAMLDLLPLVAEQLGVALLAFVQVITKSSVAITEAMTTVMISIADAVIKATPKITEVLGVLLTAMLDLMVKYTPSMTESGAKIIIAILTGMKAHIGEITDKATDLAVAFLEAIGRNLPRINQAGVDLMLKAINGVADGLRNNGAKVGEAGVNLATALVEGVIRGIGAGIGKAVDSAVNLAKSMLDGAKHALGIASPSKEFYALGVNVVDGSVNAIDDHAIRAENATTDMGDGMIDAMSKTLNGLSKVLGSDLIDFDPTITPVLDLSEVKKTAGELISLLNVPTLDLSSSYSQAQQTSASFDNANKKNDNLDGKNGGDTYNYTQYNSSPKALNPAEVYRLSRNLISTKKTEVKNAQ